MKMKTYSIIAILTITALLSSVNTDAVCDLNTLIVEIKQDLKDNGMLDCLRIIEQPHSVEETEEQKNLRLAAQWDTSCAFEANGAWEETLKKHYDINTLVDSVGEPVKRNFPNQADMCEIIRAAVSKNLFNIPDLNMQKLPMNLIDKIDCAGDFSGSGKTTNRICAASGTSYFQKDSWTIFLTSSAIKLGGNPSFNQMPDDPNQDPDFIKNPYTNKANPYAQTKLIKDLLKYSPDQLDNKEAELVNMIDNAINSNKNENQSPDQRNQKESSNNSHVHVKRLDEYQITNTEGAYTSPDVASIDFLIDDSKLVFGFYLISYKLEKAGEILFKMNFNNREIPETRHALANIQKYTSSAAFGEVFAPTGDNKTQMRVSYVSNTGGMIKTDTEDYNFSFGAITLPPGSVVKRLNSNKIELAKSDEFGNINDFNLNIKNDSPNPKFYMIMYTFSFLVNSNVSFQSRMKLNGQTEKSTDSYLGMVAEIGVHNGKVFSLPSGDNKVEIEYKYKGESISIADTTNNKFVQSIYAFEFPQGTEVHYFKLEKPLTLNTNGDWKPMGIEGKFNIGVKKTALIIYHLNIMTKQKLFKARVRINNKFNKKSVILTEGLDYAYAQAYVVKVLKAGSYSLDLEYSSLAQNTYTPELAEVNNESVFMQVVLLD